MADPFGGQTIPLKFFVDGLKRQRDAALRPGNPSSAQQSLIRLVERLDLVPGLAALPEDHTLGFKEIDELMMLLECLKKEDSTLRVLGDDTFPGTIIGRLQSAILDTGVSTYVVHLIFFCFFCIFLMLLCFVCIFQKKKN